MGDSLIVSCVGSSDPLIREYIHDFGLASWNVVALEDQMKLLLKNMAVLRAQWPMRAKKLRKIEQRLEQITLGGLISEYERLGENRELVANLRPLNETRRALLHRRIPLTPPGANQPDRARIAEVRAALQAYSRDLLCRSDAVQRAQLKVFSDLVERVKREQPADLPEMISLHAMLASFERMVRGHQDT